MTKSQILDFLRENKEYLKNRFQITRIGLFGSYANDAQTNESDIDIIVDMPSSFDGYYDLKEFLEANLKKEIDLGLEKNLRLLIRENIKKEIIYV
ncbi:MAG: nucleotidyltransferase domain-containing protein [Candidatus Cloacimonetes bacterium]|nr:nucleotidyltransferase domain-containing protein [Candidatus Cloacimonadota bacterium]